MAHDITSELNAKDLNTFKKDFKELIRVSNGINKEYSKSGKDTDKYIDKFKPIISSFNKKYKNIELKLKQTPEELKLRIFIKDNTLKDIFTNVASKLDGLKAIGANSPENAKVEEADKFSKELDNVTNKIFITYTQEAASTTVFLEQNKELIELHYEDKIENENSPELKLCAYYAVKDGINDIDIYEKLAGIGFSEMPILEKVVTFLKKFNPRIEE